MAFLGVGFIVFMLLIVYVLITKGCSVIHYPLDIK